MCDAAKPCNRTTRRSQRIVDAAGGETVRMTSSEVWRFVLYIIVGAAILGILRSGVLRLKRLPPSSDTDKFDVIRDAVGDEPQFAEKLKAIIRDCPSVIRVYLFRANVNQRDDVFSAGLVFSDEPQPDVMRQIDKLWCEETGGRKLLGITPLAPGAEGAVTRVCSPLFYR